MPLSEVSAILRLRRQRHLRRLRPKIFDVLHRDTLNAAPFRATFRILNLTSYFDGLAKISHMLPKIAVYIWRNWREGLRSVNLGHLTRIRRHFVVYFLLH